jgi:chemotaxis protein MotB
MARKKHEEAHGGAWKVAYADFVTAMMALFMVLWISAQQKEILLATSKYFQNPFTSPMPASSGVMEGKKEVTTKDENAVLTRIFTPEMYKELAEEFLKLLDVQKNDPNKPIEIKVTAEGIQITLYNREKQPIFKPDSTALTEWGEYVAQNLAWVIDRFKMRVRIDAHTPKGVYVGDEGRDAWDLTAEQANTIRKRIVHYGLELSKIDRVTGFGDTAPIPGEPPADPANYRVEMSLSATEDTPAPAHKIEH